MAEIEINITFYLYPKTNRWSLLYRLRGKQKQHFTGIKHDGKFDKKTGEPVVPPAVRNARLRLLADLEAGRTPRAKQLVEALLDKLLAKKVKIKSIKSMTSETRHVREFFGKMRADHITEDDLQNYVNWRRQGNGALCEVKNPHG